jgi:hypothetical protein
MTSNRCGTAHAHALDMTDSNLESGTKLLNSLERLLACDAVILEGVRRRRALSRDRNDACTRTIAEYSNTSAMIGAFAALPAVVPGYGTAATMGAVVAELAYVMKTEVEMCLALAALYDLDITHRDHRELAYLLAAVTTYEVSTGRNLLHDYGAIGVQAIWTHTPREVTKLLLRILASIVIVRGSQVVGRGLLRAIPLVGVGISAGMNKVLTSKTGKRANVAFKVRDEIIRAAVASRAP